ncbi:Nif-specific regulatory protein [Rhizomicrobium palustre]|uniref:Nif-specific regulatory protein n=1 Tax=Rhizomicrobium palustre TaxID=189966 RepID=A0A846N122_9PROT|nr:nif-specific transcriptional activator NifA [Rhizomicrobium palustre]NIK89175.1 Nif-specific regulatory protein [Rhizomicrobium palustre]
MKAVVTDRSQLELLASRNRAEMALGGIYEISKLLASPNRLEPTLSGVLALLASFLDLRRGLIALLTPEGQPELVVGSGWSAANARQYFERLPERAIGQIVVTKMPMVVPDISRDPLFSAYDTGGDSEGAAVSFMGVPIKQGDTVIGTLTIDRVQHRDRPVPFDSDVRFLTMVANLLGQALRLHKIVAQDRERLLSEQARLAKVQEEVKGGHVPPGAKGIIGNSTALRGVMDKVKRVAKSNSTIMLRGETGTGKEMFANAIHALSQRKSGPFIKLNCAALPESVLESELFGHEKGAFTGALALRKGRFELAHGGTLFLDEIGEISGAFQAKLLRVLQEGEFERVGGSRTIKVDVRLVCATNRDLEAEVAKGAFRADLYFRLAVVPIFLPPLRERREDIAPLAKEFLTRFNQEHDTQLALNPAAIAMLESCYFPGNVRELENCIRHTATLAREKNLADGDFPCQNDGCLSAMLWKGARADQPRPPSPVQSHPAASVEPEKPEPELDRATLMEAMEKSGWVQAKAARILGVTPRQIGYALKKQGIPLKKF